MHHIHFFENFAAFEKNLDGFCDFRFYYLPIVDEEFCCESFYYLPIVDEEFCRESIWTRHFIFPATDEGIPYIIFF